jgi:hypothetical protein
MRLNPQRLCRLVSLSLLLVLAGPLPAYAGDAGGSIDCQRDPTNPGCDLEVHFPGGDESTNGSNTSGGNGSGSNSNCYYRLVDPQRDPPPGASSGAWYTRVCGDPDGGTSFESPAMWLTTAPAVSPEALARDARSRLALPKPVVRLSPTPPAVQIVYLPTWVWLDDASWGSRSATASVPGLSITATARATRLVLTTGDGTTVTCTGHGTAWASGMNANAPSPTCGHTYIRPGTPVLTLTVTWQVTWTGGGQSGTVPDLVTTASQTITVTEAQALN